MKQIHRGTVRLHYCGFYKPFIKLVMGIWRTRSKFSSNVNFDTMVKCNRIKLKYNFVETPRKLFITAELSIRRLRSVTDEDPSLRIESSAVINLRGVSTKLYFNLIFTVQTYKKLVNRIVLKIMVLVQCSVMLLKSFKISKNGAVQCML